MYTKAITLFQFSTQNHASSRILLGAGIFRSILCCKIITTKYMTLTANEQLMLQYQTTLLCKFIWCVYVLLNVAFLHQRQ